MRLDWILLLRENPCVTFYIIIIIIITIIIIIIIIIIMIIKGMHLSNSERSKRLSLKSLREMLLLFTMKTDRYNFS